MLSRLLAVEELVSLSYNVEPGEERVNILNEWKVQMLRDWFYVTHSEAIADGPEFMCADPVSTIKPQALQELSKPSQFFKTQYQEGTILPERWHEGHEPRPFFWSNKQWDWFCEGNDYWRTPIDLLRYVLVTEPAYLEVDQFLGDLRSLSRIIFQNPDLEGIEAAARHLWLRKMIWREFVEKLRVYLGLTEAQTVTSEKKDDQNPFNTLEFLLIFEGYMHREKTNSEGQRAEDSILWQSLNQISTQEHRPVWEWVWGIGGENSDTSKVEMHTTEHDNGDGNATGADRSYNNAAQSSNSTDSTCSPVHLHPPITNRVPYPNALAQHPLLRSHSRVNTREMLAAGATDSLSHPFCVIEVS
ncbi:uncharacterized protein HD556DRAFT_1450948 [Suillus plorans]|uniref:Uncharacterized protein n=1 Tax=Suillus plorans TaxID=116603 RepID=A0A9P7AA18_9AGAM|nr:uncharacterized protein HD556DRAFT_1450948 [Suillus plorans]KAG1785197.1 hypothetical protein HD556DRAFT_1450948 [Suillus plorans]